MIFLRYESFGSYLRMFPVTAAIIAINILVYAADHLFLDGQLMEHGFFYSSPHDNYFSLDEPWRYVTAVFLHLDLQHICYNMFSMLVFAPPLERLLGHVKYAAFYLLSGIAGNLLSVIVDHSTAGAGASGAIYGVFGAYLFLALLKRSLDVNSRKTVYSILVFGIIYTLVVPNIGIWAHFGGLLAGFVLMYLYDWYLIAKRNGRY
ncbi:rhomboid family intramembrane serine protease [Paenibacillus sacheonensis]|uniref:Rhomboid family intramembrane serine protease n=1 Tax=Paenibacillus sacheonensis TaxID=742054 RepID=A0A7X5BWM4_9BACL|nr:rhomboid family intramembrane serine protease [Paenibacillus sacheonensis]MBM7565469.1 membrane associated rhomboid family serine protease [Paenibacillus sacheonensis]NBC69603.1 rhomboid family intramembrane serine protease [Paenibacillus sacheonensis]